MAERFTKLQAFPENLYTDMAPVVIVAGNLLKDNQLSRVLAQLKIKNIDKRTVDEITLLFRLMDANGKILNDAYEYKIDHAGLTENEYYGSKNPITIPDSNVKSCEVRVTRVGFTDGTIWSSLSKWNPLEPTATVDDVKARRDQKLSEATRKKEKEEYEARVQEEKHRAESKRKITIVVAVIACIAIVLACIIPAIQNKREENKRIAEQEARAGIVDALAGTSWKKTAEYVYKDGDTSTSEWVLTFVDDTTYKAESYSGTWELELYSLDSVYVIIYRTSNKKLYDSYEVTFTEKDGNYEVDFVDYTEKPYSSARDLYAKDISYTWERIE